MLGGKLKGPALKKPKKKKVPRQQPKKKSAFKPKAPKKSKPGLASKPLPKSKLKPLQKSKLRVKLKAKVHSQNQRPLLKSRYSGSPLVSATSRPKPPKLHVQPGFRSKPSRGPSPKKDVLRPPPAKSKTQIKKLALKSRRASVQHQNVSQAETLLPKSYPAPQSRLQANQTLWDTSVQASIRVGDWKLLTGYPGHGDWVPTQVRRERNSG